MPYRQEQETEAQHFARFLRENPEYKPKPGESSAQYNFRIESLNNHVALNFGGGKSRKSRKYRKRTRKSRKRTRKVKRSRKVKGLENLKELEKLKRKHHVEEDK